MTSPNDDLIEVAPREIVDAVYYCCRVSGIDPGTAHLVAEAVADQQIIGEPALADFAAQVEAGDVADWIESGVGAQADPEYQSKRRQAMCQGILIPRSVLSVLEKENDRFLVSEAAVDAVSDE